MRTLTALPPATETPWSRKSRALISTASLNPIRTWNSVAPSCSNGEATISAVSAVPCIPTASAMRTMAVPSAIDAPAALDSVSESESVSPPSATPSACAATLTVLRVSPGPNTSRPETAA